MDTDQFLLDRIRNTLNELNTYWTEKKMFGGICFMVDEKMCFGTFKEGLMVRINPEETDDLLHKNAASQMMQKDKVMKGFFEN